MFQQRDYILRIIEQMGIIIAELRRRIVGGAVADVESELRTIAGHARVDLSLVRTLDVGAILSLLSPGHEPEPTQVWLAAEILYLDGLAAKERGASDHAMDLLAKAFALYGVLDVDLIASVAPEAHGRASEVRALLEELESAPGHDAERPM